jgi:hypothetical protein
MDGRGRWMDNVFVERLWRNDAARVVSLAGGGIIPLTPGRLLSRAATLELHRNVISNRYAKKNDSVRHL